MAIKFLSDINAEGSATDINADGVIKIKDTTILETNATYTMLSDPEGSRKIYLGDGGDRTNYYDNNSHRFRGHGGSGEKMFINSSGNVGIGTTSPETSLHVLKNSANGTAYERIIVDGDTQNQTTSGSSQAVTFKGSGNNYAGALGSYGNGTAAGLGIWSGSANTGAPDFYVVSGNVGIGTTSPDAKLDVNGNIKFGDSHFLGNQTTYDNLLLQSSTGENIVVSSANDIYLNTGGTGAGTVGTTRMFMSHSTGNVGIGTNNPLKPLHVVGTGRPALFDSNNGVSIVQIVNNTSGSDTYNGLTLTSNSLASSNITSYGVSLVFATSNTNGVAATERMRVTGEGNVGIGTTSPSAKLHVAGAIKTTGDVTMSSNTTLHIGNVDLTTGSGGNTVSVECATSSGTAMNFKTSGGTVGAYMMYQGTTTTRFAGRVEPSGNRTLDLGTDALRWRVLYCETLDSAGQHESNLQDREQPVGQYITGTVLSWKDGKNRPCTNFADHMRMGIAVLGQDSPLVQGAEPVLCTGIVEEGDYLVTSEKEGHAVAIPRHIVKEQLLFDCVIGKALQDGEGESHLIKTWINI